MSRSRTVRASATYRSCGVSKKGTVAWVNATWLRNERRMACSSERSAGEYERSAATLERAIRIAPEDAALWLDLGEVRLAQGRPDLATSRKGDFRRGRILLGRPGDAVRLGRAEESLLGHPDRVVPRLGRLEVDQLDVERLELARGAGRSLPQRNQDLSVLGACRLDRPVVDVGARPALRAALVPPGPWALLLPSTELALALLYLATRPELKGPRRIPPWMILTGSIGFLLSLLLAARTVLKLYATFRG